MGVDAGDLVAERVPGGSFIQMIYFSGESLRNPVNNVVFLSLQFQCILRSYEVHTNVVSM